eukprot:403377070
MLKCLGLVLLDPFEYDIDLDDRVKTNYRQNRKFQSKFTQSEGNLASFSIGAASQDNIFTKIFPNMYIDDLQDGFKFEKIITFHKTQNRQDQTFTKYPKKFQIHFQISDKKLDMSWRKMNDEKYNKFSKYFIEIDMKNIEIIEYILQDIGQDNSVVQMMMKLSSPCKFSSIDENQKYTQIPSLYNFSAFLLDCPVQDSEYLDQLRLKCYFIQKHQAQTSFQTNFCVMQMVSAKLIDIFSVKVEFIEFLQTINKENNQQYGRKFRHQIEDIIQTAQVGADFEDFKKIGDKVQQTILKNWDRFHQDILKMKLPENDDGKIEAYSLTITPTFNIYNLNSQQLSNVILRQNQNYHDKFLKVDFKGDDLEDAGQILQSKYGFKQGKPIKHKNSLSNYVWKPISEGINILHMNYQFLGNSNSSLKQHTIWMLNTSQFEDKCDNVVRLYNGMELLQQIQESFGHLPKVVKSENKELNKGITLHTLARAAQLFSGTRHICELRADQIEYIPDIIKNGKNFSDGNGCISQELANKINAIYNLQDCSAYQFRLGGCKGTLVVNQELQGEKIQIRKSMKKFENSDTSLNIARCATPSQGFFNRQLISLIENQGIIFEDIEQILESSDQLKFINQINSFENTIKDEDLIFSQQQAKISNLMLTNTQKEFINYISESGQQMFKTFVEKRMDVQSDPFIKNLSKLLSHQITSQIKNKGRIPIKDSAILIGVADYLQVLQPGEIFLQVQDPDINEESKDIYEVITGDVIITRSPCLHPNDVMKVKAVNCNQYKHLNNVVVFSANGDEPIQSQLAGGDLDGDVFHIIWNERLVSQFTPQFLEKQKFDSKRIVGYQAKYTLIPQEIADSLLHFFKNNILGKIDSLHLAICDKQSPNSQHALSTEFLHQQAVDFQKHGCKPDIEEYHEIRNEGLDNQMFPDYMQSKSQDSYASQKIMGTIYRAFDIHSDFINYTDEDFYSSILGNYEINQSLITKLPEFTEHLCNLNEIVVKPVIQEIKDIMIKFHIPTEAELLCSIETQNSKNEYQIKQYERKRSLIQISLNEAINKYQEVILSYANEKQIVNGKIIAQAIYYITYFNQNKIDYSLLDDENYSKFIAIKMQEEENVMNEQQYQQVSNLGKYKKMMEKIRKGNQQHLKTILQFKRFFCVPWLICHDDLL